MNRKRFPNKMTKPNNNPPKKTNQNKASNATTKQKRKNTNMTTTTTKTIEKMAKMNLTSTIDNEILRHANDIRKDMTSAKPLTRDGIGFIQHNLNPCGEHTVPNSRCVDGTLSQSAVQTLRAEDFVTPPFASNLGVVPDTTRNWTLVEISPPTYTGISLLIASADARQPSDSEYRTIFTQINSAGVSDYPTWDPIGTVTPNFYVSYWRYEASNLLYDSTSRQSTSVESFRYVGDGVVVHHNCPDLWNQGGFVTGQFQCDTEYVPEIGEIVKFEIQAATITVTAQNVTFANFNLGIQDGDATFANIGSVLAARGGPPALFATTPFGQAFSIRKPDGNNLVNVSANAAFSWSLSVNTDGTVATLSTPTSVGGGFQFSISAVSNFQNIDCYSTTPALGAIDGRASIIIDLPSLNWSNIVQADPKRGSDLMKRYQGFYSVRRYFQPKLLMQKSNVSGDIKFSVKGMERLAIIEAKGGIKEDLVDINGAIRVSVLRGISYAALPQFKCSRFIELMPAPGATLASVTEVTPDRDEYCEEIFRTLQARGAHAYVPDANFLGFMATFITTVLSSLPKYLRTVASISSAVERAAEYAQEKLKFLE